MREERIIAVEDDWLATLTDREHLDAAVAGFPAPIGTLIPNPPR